MGLMKMTMKPKSNLKFIAEFEFVEFVVEFEFAEFNFINFVRRPNTILNDAVRIINCREIFVFTSRVIAIFLNAEWAATILKK